MNEMQSSKFIFFFIVNLDRCESISLLHLRQTIRATPRLCSSHSKKATITRNGISGRLLHDTRLSMASKINTTYVAVKKED
eukprot:m.911888 g.911888  ORF g.911888 m.911888 type:complete len:81 (-) comp23725_c0_seq35:253-495(-)